MNNCIKQNGVGRGLLYNASTSYNISDNKYIEPITIS